MNALATEATSSGRSAAIVTASYAGDFERCRLLCETVDARVTGAARHYLLVAGHDVALFRRLETRRRVVIDERDLLPSWLRAFPDPLSLFRRPVWLSTRTMPLRGWHVQQLRRIAVADHVPEDALVYCDSDVAFVRPFDCASLWTGSALRLYRRDDALAGASGKDHARWWANAGSALALPDDRPPGHDYISTLIAWRRETVSSMMRHIESRHGRHWIAVVAAARRFSECILYGRYVDEVLAGRGHVGDGRQLCRVYWSGPGLTEAGMRDFVAGMAPDQVAVGMQSFVGTDLDSIRPLVQAK